MPKYTVEELVILGEHGKPDMPEFKWNDIKKDSHPHWDETSGRRRSSHHHQKRPIVMPKAVIPLAQRPDFAEEKADSDGRKDGDEDVNSDIDDDFAAAYFLKQKQRQNPSIQTPSSNNGENTDATEAPVVSLKYAAALAASMHMEQDTQSGADSQSAIADDDDPEGDGWISVSRDTKNRKKSFDRRKGSFSRWRRTPHE